jgi:hypothetical protein
MISSPTASWFEMHGYAALLTMRAWWTSSYGLMVRDARLRRAPHHEGLVDLILRSGVSRVSKDEATELQML